MLRLPRNRLRRRWAHRLLTGLVLLAYCAATFGFPLPPRISKDTSQPFPCQDHLCGCQSAEQCWRSCCCLTAAERWAWARDQQVMPPSYAEPPEVQGWRTQPLCQEGDGAQASVDTSACCKAKTPAEPRRCEGGSCHEDKPARTEPSRDFGWALGVAAQRCNPLKSLWVVSGAVLPLPKRLDWCPWFAPAEWLSFPDQRAVNLSRDPLDPPPRTPGL